MFQSGMNPTLGTAFMTSTMVIAVPSAIKTFNWLGTLWGGSIRFTVPMLHALAFVSMFVIGGLSGIYMANTPVDIFIHDTYFIVAHIHYVVFGGSIFGIFASADTNTSHLIAVHCHKPKARIIHGIFNQVMFEFSKTFFKRLDDETKMILEGLLERVGFVSGSCTHADGEQCSREQTGHSGKEGCFHIGH
jgi:heme/copper-type cytochrome/quinol oxidase subunit 1